MKKITLLFLFPFLLYLFVSCKSTKVVVHTTSDTTGLYLYLKDIKKFEVPESDAIKMINFFTECPHHSRRAPVKSYDIDGVKAEIMKAHPGADTITLDARYKDNIDAARYCLTLPPGTDPGECAAKHIKGSNTKIFKVTDPSSGYRYQHQHSSASGIKIFKVIDPSDRVAITTYYSFRKICPPPSNCP